VERQSQEWKGFLNLPVSWHDLRAGLGREIKKKEANTALGGMARNGNQKIVSWGCWSRKQRTRKAMRPGMSLPKRKLQCEGLEELSRLRPSSPGNLEFTCRGSQSKKKQIGRGEVYEQHCQPTGRRGLYVVKHCSAYIVSTAEA